MPSKEADAHMLSTSMQVQDFLHTYRSTPPPPALAPSCILAVYVQYCVSCCVIVESWPVLCQLHPANQSPLLFLLLLGLLIQPVPFAFCLLLDEL